MYREQNTSLFKFIISQQKPKGKILTPFNIIAALTIIAAVVILVFRFSKGLGAVVHPDQDRPWGLWINFNVITGVAFAGGAVMGLGVVGLGVLGLSGLFMIYQNIWSGPENLTLVLNILSGFSLEILIIVPISYIELRKPFSGT